MDKIEKIKEDKKNEKIKEDEKVYSEILSCILMDLFSKKIMINFD